MVCGPAKVEAEMLEEYEKCSQEIVNCVLKTRDLSVVAFNVE